MQTHFSSREDSRLNIGILGKRRAKFFRLAVSESSFGEVGGVEYLVGDSCSEEERGHTFSTGRRFCKRRRGEFVEERGAA